MNFFNCFSLPFCNGSNYYLPFYEDRESDTVKRTLTNLNLFNIPVDEFISEMRKYNGVIAGSFMYMNYTNTTFNCGDIDIYFKKIDNIEIHPFERYVFNNLIEKHNNVNEVRNYNTIDGLFYSRHFKTNCVTINIVIVNDDPVKFIFDNFDLDCCKVVFDGEQCIVHNKNDILNGVSNVKFHKTDPKLVYKNKAKKGNDCSMSNNLHSFTNSVAFIKLKILLEINDYNKKKIIQFNNYTSRGGKTYNARDYFIQYTKFIEFIEKRYGPLDVFTYSGVDKMFNDSKYDTTILQLINTIKTLERVDKYRNRGIHTFHFIN